MALGIGSSKTQHRCDNSILPVFTISDHGAYPALFIRDFLYTPFIGDTYGWLPPNRTADLDVKVRDLILSTWTLSAGITNVSNEFTKSGADGFSGAFGANIVSGNCSIQGTPTNINYSVIFALQSGTPSHDYFYGTDIEHALVFNQAGHGFIKEKGVTKLDFAWEMGDSGLVELVGGIVRYYRIKADGTMNLLRAKRTDMIYPVIPTLTLYHMGTVCSDIRVWTGVEASTPLYLLGALHDFQDWENQASWESLAEKTMNKDKSEDFTYFTGLKNLITLSLNIRWDEKNNYEEFLRFWKYHDLSREFLFVDAARKTEFFAKFVSSFKDSPLGSDIFGMSADIRQIIDPPSFYDFFVPFDREPPVVTVLNLAHSPPVPGYYAGVINFAVAAVDNVGVDHIDVYIDGELFDTIAGAGSTITWDTNETSHTGITEIIEVKAIAFDLSGKISVPRIVNVPVQNQPSFLTFDGDLLTFDGDYLNF